MIMAQMLVMWQATYGADYSLAQTSQSSCRDAQKSEPTACPKANDSAAGPSPLTTFLPIYLNHLPSFYG